MAEESVYEKLAVHLSHLGMGYPVTDDLLDILRENFTPREAEVALAIPTGVIPLEATEVDLILDHIDLPGDELVEILENLTEKGLLFTQTSPDGGKKYALHQVGFGFPQSFLWKGEDTPHARKMAGMVAKYFNRRVTGATYGTETKAYRYIPVGESLKADRQSVFPSHMMERVIQNANLIAVGHCPCRVGYNLLGKGCDHPTEVCMKYDEMARYVIDHGLAREINKEEALQLVKKSEEAGLVHFVDNCEGEIKHNCNCCGCACWNVGSIRRRKIPRDNLMATYFMRSTDEEACTGCGACVDICPVDCLELKDDLPVVDEEWCIGCGVCATVCPTEAVYLEPRKDKEGQAPTALFSELHSRILNERDNPR
jgi:H+/Na+-translocating ferredoxin:NAD+ oxidoreductase subunit B